MEDELEPYERLVLSVKEKSKREKSEDEHDRS